MARSDEPASLRVLRVIKALCACTVPDIMTKLHMPVQEARQAVQGLGKQHFIKTVGRQGAFAIYSMAPMGYLRLEKKWGNNKTRDDYEPPIVRTWEVTDVVRKVPNSVFDLGAKL